MSECRRTRERLTPYADGTLGPGERREIEGHLEACPPCRMAAAKEAGGRTILTGCADRLKAEALPPGLRSRCEALARAHATPRGARAWVFRFVPVSLSAVFIVFAGLALFSLVTRQSDTLLAAQLTADHATCFGLFAADDAAGVDARAVEEMLADRHGWDVHVPPSSAETGVQLIGARRCLYADGRLPHAMYRVNGADVSLYMLEGVNRRQAEVLTLGHRSQIWSRGATTYVLVAPEQAGDMANAVRYLMQQAR